MSGISGDGGASGGGGIRWNDETQSWEAAGGSGAPVPPTAPPPPVPSYAPPVPAEGQGEDPTYTVTPPPAPLPRSRRTTAIIAGVTVAVVAGAVAFGVLALQDDDAGTDVSASPTATASSTTGAGGGVPTDTAGTWSTESPSLSTSPSPTSDVPSGYTLQEDTAGFTIAVPEGWERQEKTNGVFYNSPGDVSLVQIYTDTEGSRTPYESLRNTSKTLSANENYRQLSLQEAPDGPGEQAAELIYAYDRPDGTRRQVVDRAFVAENGTQYAVLVAGPEKIWPRQRETLQVALTYFSAP
ncbi:hypothetical protein [Streptomyces sp. HD]|uniref:hypothetical protein n=1 Tax=Streptomyces sp. HD TaxID=3020892 RepID=UPI00232C3AE9|nr:hypothetical protein [Streptomyces sp. HD]MDC0766015.1 hypothetical protein [Streptomyces sp. HD]